MYIKVKDLSSILDSHPYFLQLSDEERLATLNVARSTYSNFVNGEGALELLTVEEGKIGADGEAVVNLSIPELPQKNLKPLGVLTYKEVEDQTGELMYDLSDDAKKLVYTIGISKIQALQELLYEITNASDRTDLIIVNESDINVSFFKQDVTIFENLAELVLGYIIPSEDIIEHEALLNVGYQHEVIIIKEHIAEINASWISGLQELYSVENIASIQAGSHEEIIAVEVLNEAIINAGFGNTILDDVEILAESEVNYVFVVS